jgi:predicted nuclease of restriction endonuclease-like (RecB) superfamily
MTANLQPQFIEVLKLIKTAQNRVIATTNQELIQLYWAIGKYISDRLTRNEWGQKTVEQLADFIQIQEPGIKGFERRNLYRMCQFYEIYPASEIVTALRTQLSWTHHRLIMSRCKTQEERLFYLQLAATERYSTRELDRQINSSTFERTQLADIKPPVSQAPNLKGIFRDSYVLDFLNLPPPVTPKTISKLLSSSISKTSSWNWAATFPSLARNTVSRSVTVTSRSISSSTTANSKASSPSS